MYPDLLRRVVKVYQKMMNTHQKAMRSTAGIRGIEEQEKLYALGRTSPGAVVTWSRPGESLHHYGCAVDSCFQGKDPYLENLVESEFTYYWGEFGRLCEAEGLTWGGRFSGGKIDRPHAQITYGFSLSDIKKFYAKGGLRAVWSEFDQVRNVPVASEWDLI